MCFEHPAEYPSTFVRECQVFILHCVSRVETRDEKMRKKNPLNFVLSPKPAQPLAQQQQALQPALQRLQQLKLIQMTIITIISIIHEVHEFITLFIKDLI